MTDKKSSKKWEKIANEDSDAGPETAELTSTTEEVTSKEKKAATPEELLTHPSYKALQTELNEKDKLLDQAKNDEAYRRAEMENLERRYQQKVENAHKFSCEKMIMGLLPCLDNLERAVGLRAEGADNDAVLKGVELTLQMLRKVLETHGVKTVAPILGDAFDSDYHQAMSIQASNEAKPDTILSILQKGYLLQGRLIRPAAVIVAKAPEENS